MTRSMLRRREFLGSLNAALALCLALVLFMCVRPAWQERTRLLEALSQREEQAASQLEIAASLAAARAELDEVRRALALREAELAPAGGDMAVVRAIEALAGSDVALGLLAPGALRAAAAPDQPETALYCEQPLRIEAQGAQAPLLAFLSTLEQNVPGLRVRSVSLHAGPRGEGVWNLTVSGVLFLLGPCE